MRQEAQAAASQTVKAFAVELETNLARSRELLDAALKAKRDAELAVGLANQLRKILATAPPETFLSSASLVVTLPVSIGDGWRSGSDEMEAINLLMGQNRRPFVLVQRQSTMLPAGRYAAVISYHRIDGGDPKAGE